MTTAVRGNGAQNAPRSNAIDAHSNSPLCDRALENCIEELDGDADEELLAGMVSLEDLVAYAKTIEPPDFNSFQALSRLGPTLKFVDDFSAVVTICLGGNAKVPTFVWGSLRLIVTLASSIDDALPKVLDMLEELSLSLPRLSHYEEVFPVDRFLENSLVDVYSEMICFYARLIRHYKMNPHLSMQQIGWQNFQRDFTSTVRRVKYLSSIIEKKADLVKMKLETGKYEEVLEALKGLGNRQPQNDAAKQSYHIPVSMNPRYRVLDGDLVRVREALDPEEDQNHLKSYALYGMGGVGKTQLALRYALESKKVFDVVLWIAAETSMSCDQSFREAAISLGLSKQSNDGWKELSASARVKIWLSDPHNDQTWLVIFDNADDITLLRHVWPANGTGSALITSRDFNSASIVAASGLQLQPFKEDAGAKILLQLLHIENPDESQETEARKISRTLGGLPLALDQISTFIAQRKLGIQKFLPMYERNSAKINYRSQDFSGYPHTIATVFEMSLQNLNGPTLHLQNLLAFLEPDCIPEIMFEDGSEFVLDPDLEFLGNEMELGDAEEILLQAALIGKDSDERSLSIHRLVRDAVLRRMSDADKKKYFKAAVDLLSPGFPETWSKDIGHQKNEWERSERYLPHVNTLVNLALKNPLIAQEPDAWAELLLRCSWYLYEKEQYTYVKTFARIALNCFSRQDTLAYASAVDLLGLIDLDMALPQRALVSFEKGFSIRQSILTPSDPLIAFALNNLALAYTEIPNLSKAEEIHKQAIDLRLKNNPDRIGNSYSNYAVTLHRMGRHDEAENILMQCPSLEGCTDETFLDADNPRFVGDMVLLSRIRRAQRRSDEALQLANKALAWRHSVHGDRLKTCDSMYDVARLLHEHGQTAPALDLLSSVVRIADTLDAGQGHAARAARTTSRILAETNRADESRTWLEVAVALRRRARPEEGDDDARTAGEASWKALVPFMLW